MFLAGQIERHPSAHGSSEGMTGVTYSRNESNSRPSHGSGIGSNFQNTATYPKLFSTNHGSTTFLRLVYRE